MKQPDIEIYVKNATADALLSWLNKSFETANIPDLTEAKLNEGQMIKGSVNSTIPLVVTPKAAGKAFTSIWFQSDDTPWPDDLSCAESFLEHHDLEVRCSASTWTEEEQENEEKWWSLTQDNRKLVRWG